MIFTKNSISNYIIKVKDIKNTHIRELITFDLYLGERFVGKVFYFSGRGEYKPWFELDYHPWPREENLEVDLFKLFYDSLEPGSRFFVSYVRDKKTSEMLYKGYHPAETPLGRSLLLAGFTWFKDYYFAEGGNEGFQKLQANKPISEEARIKELSELLNEVMDPEVKAIINMLINKREV
ncbi:MAG: DUF1122 family protein [Sulfolobaceae archaeon]|nr:DUF1122 family protein [Sulfolobaceae archaeon]